MRKSLCLKVLLGFGLGGVALVLGAYAGRHSLLSAYGAWLMGKTQSANSWEAMFVLSGRPYERGIEAATQWHAHPTPIYLTGGLINDNLLAIGFPTYTECGMSREVLLAHCVPDSAIHLLCEGTSTYEEILVIQRVCRARQYRRIAIVSSAFHGRRVQLLARRYLAPFGIQAQFLPAKPLLFHPETWWKNEYGFLNAFEETFKILYYVLRGRF
ncbi:MAG: YdcF family protein [Bacteroidota bacterium]|nr:YdcF family protein [Bacteroidota bacterium]